MLGFASPGAEAAPDLARPHDRNAAAFPAPARRGQAQKHVTHNDALTRLDALVHLTVDSRSQTVPPAVPTELSAFIIPPGATGVFSGRTDQIALFEDGGWIFLTPRPGWQAWVVTRRAPSLDRSRVAARQPAQQPRRQPLGRERHRRRHDPLRGAGAGEPFNHDGAGHQLKLNKAAAGETASLLFQDGYSGRAEIGLAGDDDLHCKVSADGSAWAEALTVERSTGEVSLPATPWASGGNLLLNGDLQINQRGFAGGALAAGIYGFDRWKAGPAGATLSVAGYDLTLSAGALVQPVEPALWGLSSFAARH